MALSGGCLCGSVRYRSEVGPLRTTLCHCSMCRHASGAIAQGWTTVPRDQFKFTSPSPAEYRSSDSVVRTFCANCGSPLTYWHSGWPQEIALSIGSMDHPDEAPPNDHLWMSAAVAWDRPTDGLPHYPGERT